jgi:hypothetical protein
VFLRCVRLIFHSTPLVLVGTFTVGFLIALHAGLVGIPLACILASWFFKYCFVVLDSAVLGHDEVPVLSAEMVNVFDEPRPLGFAAVVLVAVSAAISVDVYVGTKPALAVTIGFMLLLPAVIATFSLSSNVFLAVWPPRLLGVVRGLRWDYLFLIVAMLLAAVVAYGLATTHASLWVTLAVVQLLFLFVVALIGSAMFAHRIDFGLESRSPDERLAERDRRDHLKARQQLIDLAYEQFRVQKPLDGWREIENWLKTHAVGDNTLTEYHAVFDAACAWDDVRPGDRLANDLIGLLLVRRQTGAALEVAARRFALNPKFKPVNAPRLAELAAVAGKPGLRRQLEPKSP